MGKQRKAKNFLIVFIFFFAINSMISCSKKNFEPDYSLLDNWVKQKYSKEAQLVVSGNMNVSFPKIKAYRGAIIIKNNRNEGVFFINTSDNSIQFFNANEKQQGGNP